MVLKFEYGDTRKLSAAYSPSDFELVSRVQRSAVSARLLAALAADEGHLYAAGQAQQGEAIAEFRRMPHTAISCLVLEELDASVGLVLKHCGCTRQTCTTQPGRKGGRERPSAFASEASKGGSESHRFLCRSPAVRHDAFNAG